jgi:hypothetical protein
MRQIQILLTPRKAKTTRPHELCRRLPGRRGGGARRAVRLLLDECCNPGLVVALRAAGHDVHDVLDRGRRSRGRPGAKPRPRARPRHRGQGLWRAGHPLSEIGAGSDSAVLRHGAPAVGQRDVAEAPRALLISYPLPRVCVLRLIEL